MVLRKSIVQAIYLKPTSREAKLKNSIIRVLTPITAVLMLVAALPQAQAASKYPDGTIRLLVPYGAGGGTDLSARLIASGLKKTLNATVVVENMPAASGQTALQTLADAEPDGYTLALASLPATNMMYLDKVRGATFSLKSFSIIGLHDNDPTGIAVSATSPYKTLADVVAAAKAKPGSITAGSSGVLAAGHLSVLAFEKAAGVKVTWASFSDSGQLRTSVINGSVTLEVGTASELALAQKNGTLRILTVLASARIKGIDSPTMAELGYKNVVLGANRVLIAPAGTPSSVTRVLTAALSKSIADKEYRAEAAKRSLGLNFMAAAATATLWKRFDATFGPIATAYRASEK